MLVAAARRQAHPHRCVSGGRTFIASVDAALVRPVRKTVSLEERAILRAARKKRATQTLQREQGGDTSTSTTTASPSFWATNSRWIWYLGVFVPSGLFAWAINDENSPPAKISRMIGLTKFITGFTDEISKPPHEKLLPDWDQMPNVPHDIPVPHTLVLNLDNTLVSSTWDRKHGWRHAKRPGVDKFLHTVAQFYEVVLYTPSLEAIADPVVTSLDKTGCIMHRLYRESTHYKNGVHVKDLDRLNRNVNRMVVLDHDLEALQFNPDNLIRVKPYEDPNDRTDRTLARITPFLVEIARQNCNDVPALLRQYHDMDADEIAEAYEGRLDRLKEDRERQGWGGLLSSVAAARVGGGIMPLPELSPTNDSDMPSVSPATGPQPTARDLVGAAPPSPEGAGGMVQWMNRRAKEKEEQNMRKFEKWNEVMMKKQAQAKAAAQK